MQLFIYSEIESTSNHARGKNENIDALVGGSPTPHLHSNLCAGSTSARCRSDRTTQPDARTATEDSNDLRGEQSPAPNDKSQSARSKYRARSSARRRTGR